jgi:hypothetical protein
VSDNRHCSPKAAAVGDGPCALISSVVPHLSLALVRGAAHPRHDDSRPSDPGTGHGSSGVPQSQVSTSLKGLAAKRLVTIAWTPVGKVQVMDLTAEARKQVASLVACCE